MDAGKLRHRVRIQKATRERGQSGGFETAWSDLMASPMHAQIENKGGGKRSMTDKGGEVSVARTEITMRYIAGIDASMRIVHGAIAYKIQHVNNADERNRWLVLTCETGVAS